MTLAIIDSGGANISSVEHALRRLGANPVFTADAEIIRAAERVILPGVGAAGAAMARLTELGLLQCIRDLKQPVLGICLGMQLLFEKSEEDNVDCLGIIPGTLKKMQPAPGLRVPHMGWNTTSVVNPDPLILGLPDSPWFYFVHSYCAPIGASTVATCDHGASFAAIVRQGNFYGAQFHPERSAKSGARLLANFLEIQ
ncbi:MAG: imidazole glycerol phosphate synthase subunit HisH [Xanthomonadales bacterium]|nr:imidazole glycerol phosphate synthase subunit HisH [Gammaproteobacteria bacterium]MBT8076634.1 imidazole glycerol phosphate synthase subunit HisH [Gammaproteobacteria bacterium]NNK03315.1 imidazole glycerol phosphate synthase subunit HisH [Xanthomonadales bacterium]NNK99044.1 imidazole glycerol phosphate synthase subunit HisH [Xanthomonadales bacterium]